MTEEVFDDIVLKRLERIKLLILLKGKEYRRGGDPHHNFLRAADLQSISPEKALFGFMSKHLVSILDILDDVDKGITPCIEAVEEKLGDASVYLILLETLLKKRIEDETN